MSDAQQPLSGEISKNMPYSASMNSESHLRRRQSVTSSNWVEEGYSIS
jgi:hypothetical protein